MKNFKLFLALSTFASSSVFGMEKGIDEARKEREESAQKIKPSSHIGYEFKGVKSEFPQNIWTNLVPLLIDRKGKTEAEIFRITDLMFYPKVNQDPRKIISKSPDKQKIANQLALAKSLNEYIKTVDKEKAVKNYEEFKKKVLAEIIFSRARKIVEYPEYLSRTKGQGINPEFSINELDFDKLNKINWDELEGQDVAQKILTLAVRFLDLDLVELTLIRGIKEINFSSPHSMRKDGGGILREALQALILYNKEEILNKILKITTLLLKYGADPLKRFKYNRSALEAAQEFLRIKNDVITIAEKAIRSYVSTNYKKRKYLEEFIKLLKQEPQTREQFLSEETKEKSKS